MSVDNYTFRAFGVDQSDLSIDFMNLEPPQLVTQILHNCLGAGDGEHAEASVLTKMTVGKRIDSLLNVLGVMGYPILELRLVCVNPECQKIMELEVEINELRQAQKESADDHLTVSAGGRELVFRKPTAEDQLLWQSMSFEHKDVAIMTLIQSLVTGPHSFAEAALINEEDVPRINEAMQEFDPLVNFSLSVRCPYCDQQSLYEIDLQNEALRLLHQAQDSLLADVHRLALHYHWSEEQILSMPGWRRNRYLAMCER